MVWHWRIVALLRIRPTHTILSVDNYVSQVGYASRTLFGFRNPIGFKTVRNAYPTLLRYTLDK